MIAKPLVFETKQKFKTRYNMKTINLIVLKIAIIQTTAMTLLRSVKKVIKHSNDETLKLIKVY